MAADAGPTDVANDVDLMLKHLYVEIGATDAPRKALADRVARRHG